MEIIPAIDIRNGRCVRLVQGDYERETVFGDDPVGMARRWVEQGAPRLHLVDLDGAREGHPVNHQIVRGIVEASGVPCQFGGGLRNDESVALLLEEIGVDRVIVGTQALKHPDWFREIVVRYPGRVALGLDARNSKVATGGWLDVSQVEARELAGTYADLPLAAVVYTNIARDGLMQGLDELTLDDLAALSDLGLPVIASGGVTTLDDVKNVLAVRRKHANLIGAIIGRALYESAISLSAALEQVRDSA